MNQNKTFCCAFILLNNITSNAKDLNDCFEKELRVQTAKNASDDASDDASASDGK